MNARRLSQVTVAVVAMSWGAYQIETAGGGGPPRGQDSAGTSSFAAATLGMSDGYEAQPVAGSQRARLAMRAISSANSVNLVRKSSGQCHAFAPEDWQILAVSPRGDANDFVGGNGRSYASWSIRGVNRAMEPYFGALYGDPLTSSRYLLEQVAQALGEAGGFTTVGGSTRFGDDYVAQEFRSASSRALIVYRLYPAGGMFSAESYVISLRMAIAAIRDGDFALKTAMGVAGSIACRTMFVPPVNNDVPLPRPGDVHDRRRQREADELADYNAQLGTQAFHSPSTGENVLVDRSSAVTNGPEGEGVYRRVGNSYEKLTPGRAP